MQRLVRQTHSVHIINNNYVNHAKGKDHLNFEPRKIRGGCYYHHTTDNNNNNSGGVPSTYTCILDKAVPPSGW